MNTVWFSTVALVSLFKGWIPMVDMPMDGAMDGWSPEVASKNASGWGGIGGLGVWGGSLLLSVHLTLLVVQCRVHHDNKHQS